MMKKRAPQDDRVDLHDKQNINSDILYNADIRENHPAVHEELASRLPDQLGPLPAGTVVLVQTHEAPVWPARVLGYAEARAALLAARCATPARLRRMRDDPRWRGAAVRFFGDDSVAAIAHGMATPYISAPPSSLLWIWRASELDGRALGWPAAAHGPDVRWRWEAACAEANNHICTGRRAVDTPMAAAIPAKNPKANGLTPGTFVWGLCANTPVWPGIVIARDAEDSNDDDYIAYSADDDDSYNDEINRKDDATTGADAAVAPMCPTKSFIMGNSPDFVLVRFFGPDEGSALMSVCDLSLFLPGHMWRDWMRARSEAERKDRGWPTFDEADWDKWQHACKAADVRFQNTTFLHLPTATSCFIGDQTLKPTMATPFAAQSTEPKHDDESGHDRRHSYGVARLEPPPDFFSPVTPRVVRRDANYVTSGGNQTSSYGPADFSYAECDFSY
jgi:hypothetical protein